MKQQASRFAIRSAKAFVAAMAAACAGVATTGQAAAATAPAFGAYVSDTAIAAGGRQDYQLDGTGLVRASGMVEMPPTPYLDGDGTSFYAASKASSAADIMSGALRVYTQASGRMGVGAAAASFFDTVTFYAPAGFTGNTVQVTETLHVFGSVTGAHMDLNYWSGYWSASVYDPFHDATRHYGSITPGPTNFDVSLTLTLPVVAGVAQDRISFSLVAYADAGCNECALTMDFGNTATVTQTLPQGWAFSSASGVFLAPVPEPASAGLYLAGLGLMGWVAARRRARGAQPRPQRLSVST